MASHVVDLTESGETPSVEAASAAPAGTRRAKRKARARARDEAAGRATTAARRRKRAKQAAAPASSAANAPPPAPEEQDEEDCAICLEKPGVNRAVLDGCRHAFCFDCVTKWAQESCNQCPVCRVRFERVMKAPTHGEPVADVREEADDEVKCVGVTIARRDQGVPNVPPAGGNPLGGNHIQAMRRRVQMMLMQRMHGALGGAPNVPPSLARQLRMMSEAVLQAGVRARAYVAAEEEEEDEEEDY